MLETTPGWLFFCGIILKLLVYFQVFLAKVLNHMMPSLTLGSIESRWVSRDQKQVRQIFAWAVLTLWWDSFICSFSTVFVKSSTKGVPPGRDRFLSSQLLVLRGPHIFKIWKPKFFLETIKWHQPNPTCCCFWYLVDSVGVMDCFTLSVCLGTQNFSK